MFVLEIQNYRTQTHLGWTDAERATPQPVQFDVRIEMAEAPPAARTDNLDDTLCYDGLCQLLERTAAARPYRLIESLAQETYDALRSQMPPQNSKGAQLEVSLLKPRTPIKNLQGGARVTLRGPLP